MTVGLRDVLRVERVLERVREDVEREHKHEHEERPFYLFIRVPGSKDGSKDGGKDCLR